MNSARSLTTREVAESRRRRLDAVALQAIEDNPLTPDEIAMFEMFEREGWPHDRRRTWILGKAAALAAE